MTQGASPTERTYGKLHVTVRRVFSSTSTETAVDKARKLILQHISDPDFVDNISPKGLDIQLEKREYRTTKGGASIEESSSAIE